MKKKTSWDIVDLLKTTGSENKRAAHVKGNAAGAHEKDVSKINRRRDKQEEREAERGWPEGDVKQSD